MKKIASDTWDRFETESAGKKIVLFGASKYANYLLRRNGIVLAWVVDNDQRKWGLKLSNVLGAAGDNGELCIENPEKLHGRYRDDEVIFVIASVHKKEICQQLSAYGYSHFCSALEMNDAAEEKTDDLVREKSEHYTIQKHKVLCVMGAYGGHEKYISKELSKNKNIDVVWVVKNHFEDIPEGVRQINEADWDSFFYELETAHIILYGVSLPSIYKKKAGQYVIFVKHWASITLKKFYLEDKTGQASQKLVNRYKKESQLIDYIFTGSEFDEESCRAGLAYSRKFARIGSPRSDAMFLKDLRKKVREYYKVLDETHLLMYAPTFRSRPDEKNSEYIGYIADFQFDYQRVQHALEENYGGKWKIIKRLHPSVAVQNENQESSDCVIDASYYEDSQELLAAVDIVITDYSSLMFEPAFVGKPVILYAPDREHYIKEERDLLIDYDSLPFPITTSMDELCQEIEQFDLQKYQKDVSEFLDYYGVHEDGHASERAAKFIVNLLDGVENT